MTKRAHPAHRMSQYGKADCRPSFLGEALDNLIKELAEVPTTSETPGAHPDELTDTVMMTVRKWVEREKRSSRWIKELE